MFVDGTFTHTCRPGGWSVLQQVLYTRYKKTHGVGCQGVMAPNGLFINWWGPSTGNDQDQHDGPHHICVFIYPKSFLTSTQGPMSASHA